MRPKSNAFRLYRCYTTLQLSAHMNFVGPGRDPSKRCFGPPRHSATFYGTPRNRRIDGTLPADFFSAPDPTFRVFRRCVCVVITTSSTRCRC